MVRVIISSASCRLSSLLAMLALAMSQAQAQNLPPRVSLLWPGQGDSFSAGTLIKLKADATDPDGSIAQVRFFAGTNLIGTVSNAPFNLIWTVGLQPPFGNGPWKLKAVATDNLGAKTESASVTIYGVTGIPPLPVLAIASPRNGQLFAEPASFTFSAEQLASSGDYLGATEFLVGTNSFGIVTQSGPFTASTPLYTTVVTNLSEGDYELVLVFYGDGRPKAGETIHVVKLGIDSPRLTTGGYIQFDVVTAFRGRQTTIEASLNLFDWVPISTNQPTSNTFTFTDVEPATNTWRSYRVLIPPWKGVNP